jgi:large subunit ribosomal protein L6
MLPAGVTAVLDDGRLTVKGPKGELTLAVLPRVTVKPAAGSVTVEAATEHAQSRMNVGTMWSLVTNAATGVTDGFQKSLEIEGVGYRAAVEGTTLVLSLGYVNPVRFAVPPGVTVTVEKNVVKVAGIDKELVGRVASQIRAFKKPEPYKGKGIRYQGEVVKRKVGKKAVTTAAT